MLLIPYGTAVGVAATWSWALGLLLISILAFYIARTSYLKRDWRWTIVLLAVSGASGLPLLWIWHRWWLAVFVAVAAWLAFRPTKRSLVGELVAVGGLTLTAPAAWYVARGELDAMALRLWVLNTLFFASGVFYVKMHVAAAVARDPLASVADRLRCGRNNLVFHAVLVIGLVAMAVGEWIPPLAMLAFVPVVVRAVAGTVRLSPVLRIKRLGWTEVAYSVAFAVLLVVGFLLTGGVHG